MTGEHTPSPYDKVSDQLRDTADRENHLFDVARLAAASSASLAASTETNTIVQSNLAKAESALAAADVERVHAGQEAFAALYKKHTVSEENTDRFPYELQNHDIYLIDAYRDIVTAYGSLKDLATYQQYIELEESLTPGTLLLDEHRVVRITLNNLKKGVFTRPTIQEPNKPHGSYRFAWNVPVASETTSKDIDYLTVNHNTPLGREAIIAALKELDTPEAWLNRDELLELGDSYLTLGLPQQAEPFFERAIAEALNGLEMVTASSNPLEIIRNLRVLQQYSPDELEKYINRTAIAFASQDKNNERNLVLSEAIFRFEKITRGKKEFSTTELNQGGLKKYLALIALGEKARANFDSEDFPL